MRRHMTPANFRIAVLCRAAMAMLVGCTDADLYIINATDGAQLRVQVEAQVCAPPDVVEQVPYKIMFVIDTSGSNSEVDPTGAGSLSRRETAVRSAISAHIDNANVSFGLITFASTANRQTFGFTRELAILDGAAVNIGTAQGGTNYSDTMWAVRDFLEADARALSQVERSRTHYLVYWISDGEPTVGVTAAESIIPGVSYLVNTLGTEVAEFSFNTAFLGGATADSSTAVNLLSEMARAGQGNFANIESGESIDFDIQPLPLIRRYTFVGAVASNDRARFGALGLVADSDGDGLPDDLEHDIGSNPLELDTDGDGIGDGVEYMSGTREPLAPDGACLSLTDSDGDGLNDCEELFVGTLPEVVDSDGDLLPDSLEVLQGGRPLDSDPTSDVDLDGIVDSDEVQRHLNPRENTERDLAGQWSYEYRAEQLLGADPCFLISARNIGVASTHETALLQSGANLVSLYVAFRLDDDLGDTVFYRGQVVHEYVFPDYHDPADGSFKLQHTDFAVVR